MSEQNTPSPGATQFAAKTSSGKVGFVSLGCPKALVDSERILTQLRMDNYEVVNSYSDADVVVVNTCGFIDDAKQESLEAIREAMAENGKVIVTGCMGKGKDAETIREQNPDILAITGPQAYEEVMTAVHEWVPPVRSHDPFMDLVPPQGVKLTPRHYSYLKISEGCNHSCTFCIIPAMRGKHVSRPIGDVLDEAKRLVEAGTRELLVISQDTSAYGVDVKYRTGFWDGKPVKTKLYDLCNELGNLGAWVRLHYVYPYPNVDDIIPLMVEGKVLPYLDIPFQHASPRVLQLMKRPAHADNTLERIKKWREQVPELVIRSTFVVGFPGETEEDFQHLLNWLEEAELDRVGCFKYSPVDGAKANELPDHVPPEVQQERFDRFMETQQAISARKLQRKIGQRMMVIVDQVDDEGAVARSMGDAPNIDGLVYLNEFHECEPGDILEVEIEFADEYDLWGAPVLHASGLGDDDEE
ncbi:30S ribosomal protein S12 methylthiotransferase RimO [Parathalassolituus penaei]|uniref:Ribosomal protein uS12 methylthiotransferase RimO n=1 Tax=Parathalassolituus penaei TaxID=2997323 RepID=A0A9X3EGJ2_9GAMM|nr:30S ribosomal protein S12 methylthiotransferase RimO [Parathalassolituus penaei]MCY0966795.1 30S ribosomal protein S12 methylthiotransferase RimO [Parathalassolituus penaei]